MSLNEDILKAFFDIIENASIANEAFPNVDYDGEKPYLQLSIIRSGVFTPGLSIDIHEGYLQVLVNVNEGIGELIPVGIADQIIALFPRNTKIVEGTTTINLEKTGWASTAIPTEDGYAIPVSIPFKVLD